MQCRKGLDRHKVFALNWESSSLAAPGGAVGLRGVGQNLGQAVEELAA